MTSSPLFIIVAESIVIFGPIFHVGWRSASSTVIDGERLERPRPERAAGGGQDEPLHLGRRARAERLVERAVLRVDGEDRGAGRAGRRA